FRPVNDPEFGYQNDQIKNAMRAASTYRVGGEYRFGAVSVRGGYRFEESPFENTTTIGDLTGYSAGLGYNFGALKLDVAYTNAQYDENRALYQVGLTDTANMNRELSSVVVSLSFGL
ncbi:MAG: porin, partial [Salegentibacter sp.]